jgi:hypothetical protein
MAYFISPHGYGHAARACAVMEALYQLDPQIEFEIFTSVPVWFFTRSLSSAFTYHAFLTDIGLKQRSALEPDLPGTVEALDRLMPFDPEQINFLAEVIRASDCRMVLCDIAPMGIRVAQQAGLPSVLIENFTWDWIYEGYVDQEKDFQRYITYLKELFTRADLHIQTEPFCIPDATAFRVNPISRPWKTAGNEMRKNLDLNEDRKLVLITMGGIRSLYPFIKKLAERRDCFFVVPGAGETREAHSNVLILPQNSGLYHPDLIQAAGLVIGKAGYSTMAEVYAAGVPFGYISADHFRETAALVAFIEKEIHSLLITEEEYYQGAWLEKVLPRLLTMPHIERTTENGAVQAARFIYERLKGRS